MISCNPYQTRSVPSLQPYAAPALCNTVLHNSLPPRCVTMMCTALRFQVFLCHHSCFWWSLRLAISAEIGTCAVHTALPCDQSGYLGSCEPIARLNFPEILKFRSKAGVYLVCLGATGGPLAGLEVPGARTRTRICRGPDGSSCACSSRPFARVRDASCSDDSWKSLV